MGKAKRAGSYYSQAPGQQAQQNVSDFWGSYYAGRDKDKRGFLDPKSKYEGGANPTGGDLPFSNIDPSNTKEENAIAFMDPANISSKESMQEFFDPLDIFGQRGKEDVRVAGEEAKQRILAMMQSANSMRGRILTQIKERDLQASKAAAGKRRELSRRSGRSSTILTR